METFQAGLDGVTFKCNGSRLIGGLYRGAGVGPRPTAILLHGLPGIEKNLDIAYALREAGWNCLYFHPRGSWGSAGAYSLRGCQDDLRAATEWIPQRACVDPQRLVVIGHSVGGYLALLGGATDSRFRGIIALCPLLSTLRAPFPLEFFTECTGMLAGVTGAELKSQYEALPEVESVAEGLLNRPTLVLTGGADAMFPPDHYLPLKEAVPTIEWRTLENGDHLLSLCRQAATTLTVTWLLSHFGQ